jgi:AcrR family transcriptional regulator
MTAIETPVNARSRRTRATLLAAARSILEEDGFEALTMGAVADRAELVGGLFDHVAGDEGLDQSLQRVWDAADAPAALDEWARHLARYHTRLLAVDRAVARVSGSDPDAARHRARVVRAKLTSTRRLARRLADEAALATPWTAETATDVLFALTSSDVVEGLTVDRHWSRQKLADHLGLLFRSTFLKRPDERGADA